MNDRLSSSPKGAGRTRGRTRSAGGPAQVSTLAALVAKWSCQHQRQPLAQRIGPGTMR